MVLEVLLGSLDHLEGNKLEASLLESIDGVTCTRASRSNRGGEHVLEVEVGVATNKID